MTTQLIDDLAVTNLEQTALEAAAADLADNDAPKLVNSLTVDELKELIADVVDTKLTSFFNSLNINNTKKSPEPERNELNIEPRTLTLCYAYEETTDDLNTHEYSKEYEDKVMQARNNLRQVENLLASTVEVNKVNPWLKMAGLHKDNPLFEGVVAYIEANRENDLVEEAS